MRARKHLINSRWIMASLLALLLCLGQNCPLDTNEEGDESDFMTNFFVTVAPNIVSASPGDSIDVRVTAEATSGSSDSVVYSLTGNPPPGTTLDLIPCYGEFRNSVSLNVGGQAPATCTVTIVVPDDAPPGDYEMRILGEFRLSMAVDDFPVQLEVLEADECPDDPDKAVPGVCGCGVADVDTDGDGTLDCDDACPNDAEKIVEGACGCGVAEIDTDGDGAMDCIDECPANPNKIAEGECGCNFADGDLDDDGTPDCLDECLNFAGTWTVTLSDITSSCGDESSGDPTMVVITQTGCEIEATGIKDSPNIVLATVEGDTVVLGPSDYSEDGGQTESTFTYTLTSDTTLTGGEEWSFSGNGTCNDGTATVSGTKNE